MSTIDDAIDRALAQLDGFVNRAQLKANLIQVIEFTQCSPTTGLKLLLATDNNPELALAHFFEGSGFSTLLLFPPNVR